MAGHHVRCAAVSGDGIGHHPAAVGPAAGDDDLGTMCGEQFGNGLADAAAGARDEGDFAIKAEDVFQIVVHAYNSDLEMISSVR